MEVYVKPEYNKMSLTELRIYIKKHRTNDEAIRELFVNRRSPDETATWYSFPRTEAEAKQVTSPIPSA